MAGQASFMGAMASAKVMGALGGRRFGGVTSAGGMYQVGEGNKPEIFRAGDGKQYMISGDRGEVISNKEISGGGGNSVVINVINNTNSDVQATSQQMDEKTVIEIVVSNIQTGQEIPRAMESSMNVTRRTN